jgi:hypothetical protein
MPETMHHKPEPVLPNIGAHKLWHHNNRPPETYESAVRQGVCWADSMLWSLGYAIGRASDEEALAILADEDRVNAIMEEDCGRFLDLLLPVGDWPTVSNHELGGEQVADYCEGARLLCNHNPTEEWLCVEIKRPNGVTWWLWVDAWMGSPAVQTTDTERGTQVVRYEVEIVPTMLVEGKRRIIWRGSV